MKSHLSSQSWQYSTVHNSACKVIEEKVLVGSDCVPHLVAESERIGARAPFSVTVAECRLAAGD